MVFLPVLVYVLVHVFSFLLVLRKEYKYVFLLLLFVALFIIFLMKEDTYDIINYTQAVSYPYFEPLFTLTILSLRPFLKPREVILVIQILTLLTLIVVELKIWSRVSLNLNKVMAVLASLVSPAAILGANNALRQFWASILLVYAIAAFNNNKRFQPVLIIAIATMIHYSALIFGLLSLLTITLYNRVYATGIRHAGRICYLSSTVVMFFFLVAFVVLTNLLPLFKFYAKYSKYFDLFFAEGRQPLYIKFFYVVFSAATSTYFIEEPFSRSKDLFAQLNFLRWTLIMLIAPMNFYIGFNEMGSRIIFFYFVIEAFMIYLAIVNRNYKFAFSILFINTFATNVWNILGLSGKAF